RKDDGEDSHGSPAEGRASVPETTRLDKAEPLPASLLECGVLSVEGQGALMKIRALVLPAAALFSMVSAQASAAEKLSPAFRAAFERSFRTGRTFAVVVQEGVPTTSVYGVDGKSSSTAHYSVD